MEKTAKHSPTAGKRPGRPAASPDQQVRQQLLAAARSLFAKQGYDAVSIRAVAVAAGVNPAMIHYYFDNKRGLYEAALAEILSGLADRLAAIAADEEPDALRRFLAAYIHTLGANPWLPPLLLREVLAEDGPLRAWFLEQFNARGDGLLARIVQREQTAGRLRADADPTLAALSLLSLAVFPFVAMPLSGDATGARLRGGYLDRLVAHSERLFLEGLAA